MINIVKNKVIITLTGRRYVLSVDNEIYSLQFQNHNMQMFSIG